MIVAGQLHGGIVQGAGQALCETAVYDEGSGQLLSGSFMDYCMPRADIMPHMTLDSHSTPCTHTDLGVKGCGEVGTIGSPAAVMNAIVDALSRLGISHVDMPATSQSALAPDPERHAAPSGRIGRRHMKMFAYHRPIECRRRRRPAGHDAGCVAIAGGMSLLPVMKFRLADARRAGRPERDRGIARHRRRTWQRSPSAR